MKIAVVHNNGKVSYVKEYGFILNNQIKVKLTSIIDDASDYDTIQNPNGFDFLFDHISNTLKVNKTIKSIHMYDKQFIRNMKIQKIKNLI